MTTSATQAANDSPELAELLRLTRAVRECADAEDWAEVVALESERRPLVARYFANPMPARDHERVAAAIREMLASDRELADLARGQRGALLKQVSALRLGQRATQAYAQNTGGNPGVKGLPLRDGKLPPRAVPAAQNR